MDETRPARRLPPRSVGLVAALVLSAACWTGCSMTPEEKYQVLSFFFDGVPDPNAPVPDTAEGGRDAGTPGKSPSMVELASSLPVQHKPFAERNCTACHTSAGEAALTSLDNSSCLKCHESVKVVVAKDLKVSPVVHGRKTWQMECLWCHVPHAGSAPKLLKSQFNELCVQCHDREALTRETPGHADPNQRCLDCHGAHGGPGTNLLSLTKPAPRPADGTDGAPSGAPPDGPPDGPRDGPRGDRGAPQPGPEPAKGAP